LNDGGEHKDKLWDIYYVVNNRSSDFDWHRCLDVVESNRRQWILCAIAITHRYLGLEITDLPFRNEMRDVPGWIDRCLAREWKRSEKLEPILGSTYDKRLLMRQVLRRIPPNPIRATIEANGDLYGRRRSLYQLQVFTRRSAPFFKNSIAMLSRWLKGT
jgi:hypothetical protein